MRSLSDLCIPDRAHDFLRQRGWGIVRARDAGFINQPDENLWAFARRERRVLISADYDFRRFQSFPLNQHPGCIVLNITRGVQGGETPTALMVRILANAMPYLPTHAAMRETRVFLDVHHGVQTLRDGTRRDLYRQRLGDALAACGCPPLRAGRAFRRLGAGAWHDAYRVTTVDGARRVVRLRKAIIYGGRERYDEAALRSDYAGVGLYYAAANACIPGICPRDYAYVASPTLACTVESYLGPALALDRTTPDAALVIGQGIGACFRALHAAPAPCRGWGELIWTPDGVRGEDMHPLAEIEDARRSTYRDALVRLIAAGLVTDSAPVSRTLDTALTLRIAPPELPVLVNGDITPENIIVRRGRFVGLIDPVPQIGNGTRYAAFFLLCYRLLLPALHDAPRYARHRYDAHAPVMARIADGFAAGYAPDTDTALHRDLQLEYFLWVLELAAQAQATLAAPMTVERALRTGGYAPIARRLHGYLAALEAMSNEQ